MDVRRKEIQRPNSFESRSQPETTPVMRMQAFLEGKVEFHGGPFVVLLKGGLLAV